MTETTATYTDEERVRLQRECVAKHIALENAGERERVIEETFAKEGAFYDIAPGLTHLEGIEGVNGFYEMLFSVLPDMKIAINHQYDVPGCCVLEGVVTGTHSAEFAGVPASGNFLAFPFCAMYLFGDDPTRLVAERAYWDNDGIIKQLTGQEKPVVETPWDHSL
jgi:steroid delta-isomerase-like uncharacterized protein